MYSVSLEDFVEDFVFLRYDLVDNGLGGLMGGYVESAHFRAACSAVSTSEVEVAYAQGTKTIIHITTRPDVTLREGDRVKRMKTGVVYRVTSDGTERTAPKVASPDMAQRVVTAEVVSV